MADVLSLSDVSVVRNTRPILDGVTWEVDASQRWVVLGPNGAGKSTLLALAAAQLHPTRGTVTVLGEQLGRTDVFELRPRIGFASTATDRRIPGSETVLDTVMTASYAVSGRWNESYEDADLKRAHDVLYDWHLEEFAERTFGTLSDGERKRVQIARAIMTDPEVLLLDEPSASLDLGARERLLRSLASYASSPYAPAVVMVTHHVEEIPVGITHGMLLRDGAVVTAGPLAETLTDVNLTETFGVNLHVTAHEDGRYSARAT
ncbi:iron ABC transporter ATP-binding protein [Pseudoclavibacter endophyticus]|uniref:ATP-binding cassette domain-containing protein n=1 Tax=Pseudoclavibacter endophyticus TaxID=1778590 RepID=A0A6H9WU12_9MICO|nr:ATP-binding cassette domain-containing protein [Pseudoclavibacter endophyticus]KAB1650165.1 ATP-binding cassette domain-containing protein [Pseudoclavibacter endophyticus]GGA56599.1 iron ABC transporter ATP-binding protein [Pseudoclavibacter endophyticus]